MNLSSLIDEYLDFLERSRDASGYTLKNYRHYLKRFREFAQSQSLTPELIKRYKIHISRSSDSETGLILKKSTQNYFLIALRNFIRFLVEEKDLNLDLEGIKLFKQTKPILSPPPLERLENLVEAPDVSSIQGYRDKAILELLIATGMKISELVVLDRDSLDLQAYQVRIEGKKGRVFSLGERVVRVMENYLTSRKDTFRPLFIRFKGAAETEEEGERMRLSARSVERMVKKYAALIGEGSITPQALRHSFALISLSDGENLKSLQRKLGHSKLSSTKVYQLN